MANFQSCSADALLSHLLISPPDTPQLEVKALVPDRSNNSGGASKNRHNAQWWKSEHKKRRLCSDHMFTHQRNPLYQLALGHHHNYPPLPPHTWLPCYQSQTAVRDQEKVSFSHRLKLGPVNSFLLWPTLSCKLARRSPPRQSGVILDHFKRLSHF